MKKSSLIYRFTILVITLTILTSCESESPCETPLAGENYTLSDSIQTYISNYVDAERIIFTRETGEEVGFSVANLISYESQYQYGGICQEDPNKGQTTKGTSQVMELVLLNTEAFLEPIYVYLAEIPNPQDDVKESLFVTLGQWPSNSSEEGDWLFGIELDNPDDDSIFSDSLTINNKKFYDVFEPQNSFSTPKLEIKYTNNEGVIYIRNPENGNEFVYERKE